MREVQLFHTKPINANAIVKKKKKKHIIATIASFSSNFGYIYIHTRLNVTSVCHVRIAESQKSPVGLQEWDRGLKKIDDGF